MNTKPFDLEAAKNGAPVCTRDGRAVRILCYDKATNARNHRTIVALIQNSENNGEYVEEYYSNGNSCCDSNDMCDCDLMMAPVKYKKWMNIYRIGGVRNPERLTAEIYGTEEEALKHKDDYTGYITTKDIEWEE